MDTLRREVVQNLVNMLTTHDVLEKELLQMARRSMETTEPSPLEIESWQSAWAIHDKLERDIIYAMAAASDLEIWYAIEEYDNSDAGKSANVLSQGQERFAAALERLSNA